MIDLGPHAVFIVWSYLGVALAIAGLIGWTLYDSKVTTQKLEQLDTRRSGN